MRLADAHEMNLKKIKTSREPNIMGEKNGY
jgi:hypothetical protein